MFCFSKSTNKYQDPVSGHPMTDKLKIKQLLAAGISSRQKMTP